MSEDPLNRVYVDARSVDVPPGSKVIDALAAADSNLADLVRRGARTVTDSRGLPISTDDPIVSGAILRTLPARGDKS